MILIGLKVKKGDKVFETKSKFMVFGFLGGLCLGFNLYLEGAIGCAQHVHSVDQWDQEQAIYQNCSCACPSPMTAQGYCPKCGHLGRVDRGHLTAQAEKLALKPFLN
jgi:hypothetical protein